MEPATQVKEITKAWASLQKILNKEKEITRTDFEYLSRILKIIQEEVI